MKLDKKFQEIVEIVKNHPRTYAKIIFAKKNLLDYIIEKTPLLNNDKYKLNTRIFWVIHKLTDFPKCKTCGKDIQKNIKRMTSPQYDFCCNKCVAKNIEVQQKRKNTFIQKYGSDNNFKLDSNKEKIRKTCLEKYGCENVAQNKQVQEKMKRTNCEKYGCEFPSQNKHIQEKMKQTNLEKFGVEYVIQNQEILEKQTQTFLKKFGCSRPAQNREIRLKQQKKYFYDNIYFDSAPEVALYIYLLDNHIDFEYQPDINFEYLDEDSKKHRYFPDFRIEDKYYEIKGDHFFNENNELVFVYGKNKGKPDFCKHQCMIDNNVIILRKSNYDKFISYVKEKYGNNFLKKLKIT